MANNNEIINEESQHSDIDLESARSDFPINLKIQESLEKCENYFVSWLRDSKLNNECIPVITNELYRIFGRIVDDSEVDFNETNEKLTNHENENSGRNQKSKRVENSQVNKTSDKQATKENIKPGTLDKRTENKFEGFSKDHKKANTKSANNSNVNPSRVNESVKYKLCDHPYDLLRGVVTLIELFVNIHVGNINEANKQILLCKKYINSLIIEDKSIVDFVPGFDFLLTRLEIHLRLRAVQPNGFNEKDMNSISNDFNKLSDRSKTIVHAAKWRFLELLENRTQESLEALQKVAALDDKNYIWNYMLSTRLRLRRLDLHGLNSKPDEREIKASVVSVEMSRQLEGIHLAMSKTNLCQIISDVLRWRILESQRNVPITVGSLTFESNCAIIKYLKEEARLEEQRTKGDFCKHIVDNQRAVAMMASANEKVSPTMESKLSDLESREINSNYPMNNGELQKQLENCKHYFILWMGDSKLENDVLPTIVNELYQGIGRFGEDSDDDTDTDDESDENEKVQNSESSTEIKTDTKKQIGTKKSKDDKTSDTDTKQTEDKIDDTNADAIQKGSGDHEKSVEKSEEESSGDAESVDDLPDCLPLQTIIAPLIESFLNIQVGKFNAAKKEVVKCTKYLTLFAKKRSSFEAYIPGFDFLITRLKIHLKLKESMETELNSHLSDVDFDTLNDKSKSVVYAAKWMLLELLDDRKEESVETLQTVASLDNSLYTWNYVLCMRLRFLRRQLYGPHSKPDEKEIKAAVASVEISEKYGEMPYAICRAGLCQTISEVLRWRMSERQPNDPISFGKLTFDTNIAMIKFLKKEARNALCRFPRVDFGEHMRYSEIFSTGLPPEHRNYEIAIMCMTFCLRLFPKNSKANHKMGILYLVADNDVKEAIPFFRKAVKFGLKSYPAWMDLIQSLLQCPDENNDELQKAFEIVGKITWSEKQTSSLKFLQGCHLFMKGDKSTAIDIWVSMYNHVQEKDDNPKENFHGLYRIKSRYQWPQSAMQLEEVQHALQERLQHEDDPDKGLQILKSEIATAIRSRRDRVNSRSQYVNDTSAVNVRNTFPGTSEVDREVHWRQSSRNSSSSAVAMSSSPNTSENYSSGRNYFSASGNSNYNTSGRYDYKQRRRTPSPDNWRN